MRRFDEGNLVEEFTKFVRDWVELLSNNKFEAACSILDKPQTIDADITWNVDNLKEVFLDYCWQERMPVINNPYQMDLSKGRIYFYQYDDGSGYSVEYDIPMEGEWGDLTAQFNMIKIRDEYFIRLYDIHVL